MSDRRERRLEDRNFSLYYSSPGSPGSQRNLLSSQAGQTPQLSSPSSVGSTKPLPVLAGDWGNTGDYLRDCQQNSGHLQGYSNPLLLYSKNQEEEEADAGRQPIPTKPLAKKPSRIITLTCVISAQAVHWTECERAQQFQPLILVGSG